MARIFISHSSRDAEAAARIKDWLTQQGFATLFLDFDKDAGIPPGADWEKTLYRQVERSEAMIIIQTPNWLASKWCFAEFTQARALGKAIFPIIEAPSGETLIAPDIQALNLLNDREGGLDQLSRELTRIALDAQGGFEWDNDRPPYPGLSAFQEQDAAIYFGRDDDVRRLIERLNARRAQGSTKLIALLGASGSGKSSLLRAGVIPRIKRDQRNWIVLPPVRPRTRPVDELARAIALGMNQGAAWRTWRDDLNASDLARTFRELASDLRMQAGSNDAQILIPIDQGEELYGASDPEQAARFLEILSVALSDDLPFLAVLAQRSDYLDKLQSAETLTARFEEFSLGPLPLSRIPQIIEGPARVAGLGIEEGLVLQAAQDAQAEDALPLLAFTLRELFDRYGTDNRLSLDDYFSLGDAKETLTPLENAVRKAADDVLRDAQPGAAEQTALRDAFVPAMVRVNDTGEYVRRPAQWDDLPAKAHPLLERLARARLLVISQEGQGRMVEVAHEALLRKWPRLRDWLDEARAFLKGKQQLERDLADWERATDAEKGGALLTGLKLARARSWMLERPHQLSGPERAFIEASAARADAEETQRQEDQARRLRDAEALAAANKKAAQRTRVGLVTALLLAAMVSVAGGYAFNAARVAEDAEASAQASLLRATASNLALEATANADTEPELAMLLALEGAQLVEDTPALTGEFFSQFEALIRNGLLRRGRLTAFHHGDDRPLGVHVARAHPGEMIVATSESGLKFWDVETGAYLSAECAREDNIDRIDWSPDGKHAIIGSSWAGLHGLVEVKDDFRCERTSFDVTNLTASAWSSDGKRFVTAHQGGDVYLYEVVAGDSTGFKELTETHRRGAAPGEWDKTRVNAVCWHPDGNAFVTVANEPNIVIWDGRTGEERHRVTGTGGHSVGVTACAWHADGTVLATGDADGKIFLWNYGTSPDRMFPDHRIDAHTGAVHSLDWSPADSVLLSAGDGIVSYVWNNEGQMIRRFDGHDKPVVSAEWNVDGTFVLTASQDRTARVWNAATGLPHAVFTGHTDPLKIAQWSQDGSLVMTASQTGLGFWDPHYQEGVLATNRGKAHDVSWHPNGGIAIGTDIGTMIIADPASDQPPDVLQTSGKAVTQVIWNADGSQLLTLGAEGSAQIWNADGSFSAELQDSHNSAVIRGAWNSSGTTIATAGDRDDNTIRIWNARDGTQLTDVPIELAPNTDARPLNWGGPRDLERIVVGIGYIDSPPTETLWFSDVGKTHPERRVHEGWGVDDIAWSPDKSLMAYSVNEGANWVSFRDMRTEKLDPTGPRVDLTHRGFHMDWSPDGKWIAVAEEVLRIIDVNARTTAQEFQGPTYAFLDDVTWNPNGAAVVLLLDKAGNARVLNTSTQEDRGLLGHSGRVLSAAWSPDGTQVVTVGADGTTRMHAVVPASLKQRACRRLTRNLTDAEWQSYLSVLGDRRKTCARHPL